MTLTSSTYNPLTNIVAPLSGQSVALQKAYVTNGIKEVIFISKT